MPDQDYINAFKTCSIQALREDRSKIRLRKQQELKEHIEDAAEAQRRSTLPVVEELKSLVEGLQEQNRILQSQIDEAKKDGEETKKEAKKARIFSWISFGVATAISIVALIISFLEI